MFNDQYIFEPFYDLLSFGFVLFYGDPNGFQVRENLEAEGFFRIIIDGITNS